VIQKVIITAIVIAAVAALLFVLTWTFQERIAFQPPRGPWPVPTGVVRADYRADDGQPLFAYIVGNPETSRGLLISFHGNADLAVWQIDWAREANERTGFAVMLAEYRGYMGLDGKPSYAASQRDATAAYRYAFDSLGVPESRIAIFGHSMGSAIAAELAARHPPAALLLQSPFTSARDMARRVVGYRPPGIIWRLISRLHFDTGAKVARLSAPVSVAHGGRDRLIPSLMGEQVYAAARVKGQWLLVPEAAHNDVSIRGGEAYWSWMKSALAPTTE
jgi:pimeloyl-ACP methyl ester carboxylesterase